MGDAIAPEKEPRLRMRPRLLRAVSAWCSEQSQSTPSTEREKTHLATIPGSTVDVMRSVPVMFTVRMSSISCCAVSAKSTGMVCDFPTLFTAQRAVSTLNDDARSGNERTENANVKSTDGASEPSELLLLVRKVDSDDLCLDRRAAPLC